MTNQTKTNHLNYLIDTIFLKINRLFVLLFKNDNLFQKKQSFSKYYVAKVKIKDSNVLIDGKRFLMCQ